MNVAQTVVLAGIALVSIAYLVTKSKRLGDIAKSTLFVFLLLHIGNLVAFERLLEGSTRPNDGRDVVIRKAGELLSWNICLLLVILICYVAISFVRPRSTATDSKPSAPSA